MTHEEIKILISAYLDNEVTPSQKDIVEEHLSTCESCQNDFRAYKAMSSSLSKWSDESLSPDEEINVQKRFEQRREPMFTNRTLMALGTTLALTIIIGSVVQTYVKRGMQGRLKSTASDISDQYSDGNVNRLKSPIYQQNVMAHAQPVMRMAMGTNNYQPYYYADSNYGIRKSAELASTAANGTQGSNFMADKLASKEAEYNKSPFSSLQAQSMPVSADYNGNLATVTGTFSAGINPPFGEERKVITNEEITLEVPNAENTQGELEGLVTRYDGIVINFNINKIPDGSRGGVFVFKVLPKDLKSVLREVRRLGEVQSENQSGEDVTDQYDYLQARLLNYQKSKEQLNKILAKNANNVDNNLTIQTQLDSVNNNINSLQSSLRQYDDQSYMATVVVNFYDTIKVVNKAMSFKEKFLTTMKEDFKSTLQTAYEIGINSFSGIFIIISFLLQIVLWSLLFWGIYLIVKQFFRK